MPLRLASRPGCGAAAGSAPGAAPLPPNSLRSPPRSAATGCSERVNAEGGGARTWTEEGAEARHRASGPFFRERRGGGAESLSLGHVIISERELRGSRRLGDRYKTQPGERVAATAAAAASPAPDPPGSAAAAAARTAGRAWGRLASSRHSQTPTPARGSRPTPPPLRKACTLRACRSHQTFSPAPQATAHSSVPGSASSRWRKR